MALGLDPGAPSPALIAEARDLLSKPKYWLGGRALSWKATEGRQAGFELRRAALGLTPTVSHASLFVDAYYKPTTVEGSSDKCYFNLIIRGCRAIAVHENGVRNHKNLVGQGRPLFRQRVPHPHLHTPSDDGFGYAEPIDRKPLSDLWQFFLRESNIVGAPPFSAPPLQGQLEFPP